MASLPLFPLGTVLMPGAQLPLQIFEPRYVRMLRDLVDAQDERPPVFGVIAIREGFEVGSDGVRALHPIGCAARLTQAAAIATDRFLVVCRGTDRFTLEGIEPAGTDYFTASVSYLDETDGDADAVPALADRLRREVAAYRSSTASAMSSAVSPDGGQGEVAEPPDDGRELSYWLPEAVNLDLAERQRLLACPDTAARLRLALGIVRRERALAETLGAFAPPPDRPFSLN
ncbi:LON peptidase substrate-binding domain-containing protein [Terracoccus luteus]|jgi:Lon protease-like protein|uniref:Lon N-terminal domain-containing protein n=1 Tax=Terracoccus luteus TaxID=53356 RepID=A0A839PW54_9MICO|nr:LON peptidase substrate-binding domain-containing protein [Terracoccus luteus]MBB2987303.1 hypothetical protein [Terracoccus luteus]MCP2172954.1 hypothetical protein [Terracoccus luteus]